MKQVNKMKSLLLLMIAFGFSVGVYAQTGNVGINTNDPKATLDVKGSPADASKLDGIILPRLTGEQLRAKTYTAAQKGAQVYVTVADPAPAGQTIDVTAEGNYYFNGTKWVRVGGGSTSSVAGDATDDAFVNDANTGLVKLGTKADGATARDAGTEFVVTDEGNVGVGTDAPTVTLDVKGKSNNASVADGLIAPRLTGEELYAKRSKYNASHNGALVYVTEAATDAHQTGLISEVRCAGYYAYNHALAKFMPLAACPSESTGGTAVLADAAACGDNTNTFVGTMRNGLSASSITMELWVEVSAVGTWEITTDEHAGVRFKGSGNFTKLGCQKIVLTGEGTFNAEGAQTWTTTTEPAIVLDGTVVGQGADAYTLATDKAYYIVSTYDEDYLPYTKDDVNPATVGVAVADGTNEATALDIQGVLTTNGVVVKIPYEVKSGKVTLQAFTKEVTVAQGYQENGTADATVVLSWSAQTLTTGKGFVMAVLKAKDNDLNAIKLDLNKGIGNTNGLKIADFPIDLNGDGTKNGHFYIKVIPGLPDARYNDVEHRFVYMPIVGRDGNIWLSNNLGANYANTNSDDFDIDQQAGALNDYKAYGSLYQWGRFSDGHELINWISSTEGEGVYKTTSTLSNSYVPGHSKFILAPNAPYDWLAPQNDNLWQGADGINNPCPKGYRVPTDAELTTYVNTDDNGTITNSTDAYDDVLKFTVSGYRHNAGGAVYSEGSYGYYRSSTVDGINARSRYFYPSSTNSYYYYRALGFSIRCLKD